MNLTYLGSFDDRSVKYSKSENLNVNSLNDILFAELLFSNNSQIVINDGYLVHSPILKEALKKTPPAGKSIEDFQYEQSPLFAMLKNKRVRVLGRKGSLIKAVEHMLTEDNETYKEIAKQKDWKTNIELLDRDLTDCFMDWPKINISHGFIKLMKQISKMTTEELGLKLPQPLFDRIFAEFINTVDVNPDSPRNTWENIVKHHSNYKTELMAIANRAYHYNWGMCIKASDLGGGDVKVNSIASNLFQNRTESNLSKRDLELLNFSLPRDFKINDEFIDMICRPGRLRNMHDKFVASCNNYIDGRVNPTDLVKIQDDFRKLIGSEARRLHRASPYTNYWNVGFALTGACTSFAFNEYPVVGFMCNIIGATPGGISIIQDLKRYRGKGEIVPFKSNNIILDNLSLSEAKAINHVKNLPPYVPK